MEYHLQCITAKFSAYLDTTGQVKLHLSPCSQECSNSVQEALLSMEKISKQK